MRYFYLIFIIIPLLGSIAEQNTAFSKEENTLFYETGELKGEGKIKHGKRVGSWIFYYKNGAVLAEGKYTLMKKRGHTFCGRTRNWVFYNKEGEVLEKVWFTPELYLSCGWGLHEQFKLKKEEVYPLEKLTRP